MKAIRLFLLLTMLFFGSMQNFVYPINSFIAIAGVKNQANNFCKQLLWNNFTKVSITAGLCIVGYYGIKKLVQYCKKVKKFHQIDTPVLNATIQRRSNYSKYRERGVAFWIESLNIDAPVLKPQGSEECGEKYEFVDDLELNSSTNVDFWLRSFGFDLLYTNTNTVLYSEEDDELELSTDGLNVSSIRGEDGKDSDLSNV